MMGFAAAAIAADKPNFSGDWKLNTAKSELGPIPPPSSMTEKIDHKDPDMKVSTSSVGGPQGDLNYELKYTTDGKECVNHIGDSELKSTVNWQGDALAIHTKADFGQGEMDIKGNWTLSSDGKTLKQTAHIETPQGPLDLTYIFDKQ